MTAYIKRKSDNEVLHSCSGQSTENDLSYLQELVTKYGYEQNDCIIGDADNSEIQSWITETDAKRVESAKTYADRRREEYLDIGEQLDMLWHAMDTGVLPKVDSFYDIIKTTKDKYPKE